MTATYDGKPVFRIEHDGFEGTEQGRYTTREGKRGVVLQQVGTKVVHVYGEKWLPAPLPTDVADEVVEEACRNICKLTGEKDPDRLVYAGQNLGSVPAWRLNEKIARAALDSFIAHPPKPQAVTDAMVETARQIIAKGIRPSIIHGKVMVAIPDSVVRAALAASQSEGGK